MKMKTSWILCGLFLIGSLTTINGIEGSDAEETLISGAIDSGIISTFVPDTQSSGYMLAYPLDEALGEKQEEDDHYLTAESFQSYPVIAKTQSLDPKQETLKEASSDDKDKQDDKIDEPLYMIGPDVEEVSEKAENISLEEETVNTGGMGDDAKIPFYNLPLSSEENKSPIQTEPQNERRLKTEDLRNILGLEPTTIPLYRNPKPISENKPRSFRFSPVYSKYSHKQQQPFVPLSLRIDNKLPPQFPSPKVEGSMLMRRALILGSGLNQNIQRQPEQNNEDIFVVASNTNSEKRNAFSTDPYLQPLPRFHPNSIRKTCIGAMRNPAFFRRQFKQKPIRRPHFQMKPNLVYSKPNRHLIYAESDYSAAPFSPTAPPISFKQQKIGPFDPSYTKPYPPFQSILMHLGYPQRSSRLQYPQRPHPVYKPQGKAYYSHLFQPTAAQSVFLNQVQNNRPAPFHQQPFSYRYPFPVSFSHGKPNILPISYPNMIQDERSNSVQFQELRFLDDQESMPRMLNSQPIISESQYSPAPRTVMSQLGYYGTTVQDQSKQQIVPVFVPVPIPVPVAVADPRPLSEEESQGQQLIPFYLQDPYSEETHPKDQEHDMMMIYNERQRPEILQSPRLVASEKRPITKHFSSEEVLEKMRMLRQLILGKYFPNPITEMDYIPSKESTTSAEIKSEMIEMFVPFSSQ